MVEKLATKTVGNSGRWLGFWKATRKVGWKGSHLEEPKECQLVLKKDSRWEWRMGSWTEFQTVDLSGGQMGKQRGGKSVGSMTPSMDVMLVRVKEQLMVDSSVMHLAETRDLCWGRTWGLLSVVPRVVKMGATTGKQLDSLMDYPSVVMWDGLSGKVLGSLLVGSREVQ